MNRFTLAAATAALMLGSVSLSMAQDRSGASGATPGHEMQQHGSMPGKPGASGYAPGHQDRDRRMAKDRDDHMGGKDVK